MAALEVQQKTGSALPLSALRLVVPPLRLMSAFLWQVVQRGNVTQYGKLEQFVLLVSETVPDIMSQHLLNKLVFHLRKKVILELCFKDKTPDVWIIQAHLDTLRNLTNKSKDIESEVMNSKFIKMIHNILEDTEKRESFLQNVLPVEYGSGYDAVLQSLAWEFLTRVDELLPVPNLKETASWLCGALAAMEDIVQPLSDPVELRDVLQHFKTKRHKNRTEPVLSSSSIQQEMVLPASSIPHEKILPPSSIAQETIIIAQALSETQSESDRAAATIMSPAHSDAEETEALDNVAAEVETELQEEEAVYQENSTGMCEVQQIYLTADGSTVIVSELDSGGEDTSQLQFLEQSDVMEAPEVREISMEEWISEIAGKVLPLSVMPSSTNVDVLAEETAFVPIIERPPSIKSIINRKSSPTQATASRKVITLTAESQANQDPGEKKHTCRVCKKEFRYECQLKNHMRAHTGERPFQCSDCGKSFRCLSFLSSHVKTHSLSRPFKCTQCAKTFRKKADLIKHVRVHTGEKPYKCNICGKSFSQGSYLKIHRECHTSEDLHQCPHCEKFFPTAFKLAVHIRYHSMARSYMCNVCGKSFIYASLLRRHKGYHMGERKYLCTICGKSFVYMFDLKKHQRNHEKPRVRIPCRLCHKTFAGPEMLRCHLRIHTGERPFGCKVCGKTFSQIGNMKRHERVHTGERPYVCTECGKTYKHSSHLKNHMLNHTGERPWRCTQCGKSFKFQGPLKKHEQTHLAEQTRGRKRHETKNP
ncbi:zinc finger protein 480 isoform X1 [Neoarius graeffei]|uniref:zinc finger protein 480 isoform X1 n=2 Tax=Neoarius graeffei TaxID=443677 RepID=UPI00298CD97A|nr:zinc finger protein 480 isoform X1 [Neoarius graeffei]